MSQQITLQLFSDLLSIADQLLGPNGCPWDHSQTLLSLREYLLEESYELIDAINEKDDDNLVEELGDLFYCLIFISKLGEKENRFFLKDALKAIKHKLINRHPHVFGDTQINSIEDVRTNWQKIKEAEKPHRKHALDGIPKQMPALARAYEVIAKTKQEGMAYEVTSEEQLGKVLWEWAQGAVAAGIHPELALAKYVKKKELQARS